jgi:hypothetical protein
MDSPYGAGMDPMPYIAFAYILGLVMLFGYGFFCFMKHGKLNAMRQALQSSEKLNGQKDL